jgi:hypothetical protein
MMKAMQKKFNKRWGAFDDDWNLVVDGKTERDCRKALTEYRSHAITTVEPTYKVMEYYDES